MTSNLIQIKLKLKQNNMKQLLIIIAVIIIASFAKYYTNPLTYHLSSTHDVKYSSWYSTRHNNNDTTLGITLCGDSLMYTYYDVTDSGYTYSRYELTRGITSGY